MAAQQEASDEAAAKVKLEEDKAPEPSSAEQTKVLDSMETMKNAKSSDSEAAAVKEAECCIIC